MKVQYIDLHRISNTNRSILLTQPFTIKLIINSIVK